MDAGRPVLMCIDGRCASGKSTLAALLAGRLEANVVHADDFYLQPFQRTPERYAEPGGNLDRERLLAEVIRPWQEKGAFSYRPYDAHDDTFGAAIDCPHRDVTIIEGSYSTHPDLWPAYDLHVFLTVDTKTQLHRIRIRNGEEGKKEFVERWIPLEEHYFGSSNPADRCELCFET
ncbi:MAG: uridine kinase [Clostridia bacterium]|nr:uridine kinase [Clostridia bacterium]